MTVFQQQDGDSPVLKAESSHKSMLQFVTGEYFN
jgi:hypothetical protein